jgi:hypothetical protein
LSLATSRRSSCPCCCGSWSNRKAKI